MNSTIYDVFKLKKIDQIQKSILHAAEMSFTVIKSPHTNLFPRTFSLEIGRNKPWDEAVFITFK